MFFAELNLDPSMIGMMVLMLLACGAGLHQLRQLKKDMAAELKSEPAATQVAVQQPLVVKSEEEFVERADCDKMHQAFVDSMAEKHATLELRVEKVEHRLDDRLEKMEIASKVSRAAIYDELRSQGKLLAANTQKTDLTYAQLQAQSTMLANILSRVSRHDT